MIDRNQFEQVVETIRESKVPTVAIASDVEGFYYVGIDNKRTLTEVMEHLYTVHHCRKFILPDAFVCANDNIAAGLIYKVQNYGYFVPRDFRVTGFDNMDNGYVYRFGGDEFIVFFPCKEEAEALRFRDQVSEALQTHNISVSMGVSVTNPSSGKKLDDYLKIADQDMYRVKAAKKAMRK